MDPTLDEVNEAIANASRKLKAYRLSARGRLRILTEKAVHIQTIDLAEGLLKEAFLLGPSGEVCDKCGGSGRKN